MIANVNNCMSLLEIVAMGEDESLYTSLTSNTIHTAAERSTRIVELMAQLAEATDEDIKENLISQITTLADDEKTALETRVELDLNAQEALRSASELNDTAHLAVASSTGSKLFDIIATSKLRDLTDKLARKLD